MSTLLWFRRDLRLADNPALAAAAATGEPVIPVYIFAPGRGIGMGTGRGFTLVAAPEPVPARRGSAGHRLLPLHPRERGLARNAPGARPGVRRATGGLEPALRAGGDRARSRIKTALREAGLETKSYNSALLHEPWTIHTQSGGPFQVFTAYWRACKTLEDPIEPQPAPAVLRAPARWPGSQPLESLELLPKLDWAAGLADSWNPGSDAAHRNLSRFLQESFDDYGDRRDRPAVHGTSRLSPHLHFGEIGPREIWHATRRSARARGVTASGGTRSFSPRSAGASSPITCCFISRRRPKSRCEPTTPASRGDRAAPPCEPGNGARPDTPLWMQACASCGVPAGCTIACA